MRARLKFAVNPDQIDRRVDRLFLRSRCFETDVLEGTARLTT